MAKYRQLSTDFWNDQYIASLPPTTRYFYLYLKLNEHVSTAGCCELPDALMALECGLEYSEMLQAMRRLEADGKIKYADGWIALQDGIDGLTNSPKVRAAVDAQLAEAPQWVGQFVMKKIVGDDRVEHPAIATVWEISRRYPKKELWDPIIEVLGDDIDVELLMEAHAEWSRRGYNPTNYNWVLDWYANGRVPYKNGKQSNTETLKTYREEFSS